MTYETFKEAILSRISHDIPDPKKCTIQAFYKNNGSVLDGLVILEKGCNISPALYLNCYYDRYRHGECFRQIYDDLLSHYEENKTDVNIDVSFFTVFKKVRSHITMKLISYEKNRRALTDLPHIRFLDLAIVFYCFIPMDDEIGNATILIHNSHMEFWGIDADTLFQIAMENSPRLLPPKMQDLNTLLEKYVPAECYGSMISPNDPLYPMFILTNEAGMFGASCILYDNLLRAYSDRFQTDLCILPSSVHEVLLVPMFENDSMETFSEMVREVNRSHVVKEEILSDHAYYYSRSAGQICM